MRVSKKSDKVGPVSYSGGHKFLRPFDQDKYPEEISTDRKTYYRLYVQPLFICYEVRYTFSKELYGYETFAQKRDGSDITEYSQNFWKAERVFESLAKRSDLKIIAK